MDPRFLVLDMFSGGGGLTEGFIRNSFDFIGHIEKEGYAAKTLETRLFYHDLAARNKTEIYTQYYYGETSRDDFEKATIAENVQRPYIINREISDSTELSIISEIRKELETRYNRKTVDVIIGGPPCQAYSLVGRGKDENGMQKDYRNYLYLHYLKFLKCFKPEIFVFENVPGILNAKKGEIYKDFLKRCSDLGYHLDNEPHVLNAADFSVLQNRNRVIFIGWKEKYSFSYPEFENKKQNDKTWALLNDLPVLQAGEGCDNLQHYRTGRPSAYLKKFGIRNGYKGIRHHDARIHNENDRQIYRYAITSWNELEKRVLYAELPPDLKTHKNQKAFKDRFKVVAGNFHSHSILAHLGKDGHYFIHPDINQARSLTVREAARIQSFPDDYLFEGSRQAKFVQIGNAVPPLMAEGIGAKIKKMLSDI